MSTENSQNNRYFTISIDIEHVEEFEQFCKYVNIKKKDFVPIALKYFKAQGINPTKHESPKSEIEKVTKRLDQFFAFFKKQEQEIVIKNYELLNKRIGEFEELTRKSHSELRVGLTQNELWLQQIASQFGTTLK